MSRAVFLDRDGVLNPLVYNVDTGEYESPHQPEEFSVYPCIVRELRKLAEAGFLLFLISNQPSFAKGKTTLENIRSIHGLLAEYLREQGIAFAEYYYCYHHPEGMEFGYSIVCECRKPKPFFLRQAAEKYELDLAQSWMVGDQDTDVQCGQSAGVRTIQILNPHSVKKRGKSSPDYQVGNIAEAVKIILEIG